MTGVVVKVDAAGHDNVVSGPEVDLRIGRRRRGDRTLFGVARTFEMKDSSRVPTAASASSVAGVRF